MHCRAQATVGDLRIHPVYGVVVQIRHEKQFACIDQLIIYVLQDAVIDFHVRAQNLGLRSGLIKRIEWAPKSIVSYLDKKSLLFTEKI